MKNIQPLIQCDFYKQSHVLQYPQGTNRIYSNLTARRSRFKGIDKVVFFGLQYFLKEYLIDQWQRNFFDKPWEEVEKKYLRVIDASLGKGAVPTEHIKQLHDLGYLPIKIKALPEGARVGIGVPVLTITNTVDHAYWLVNFLETIISCSLWQAATSATLSYEIRRVLNKYAEETGGNMDFVNWQAHDFSMRGMSSLETACVSGAAHLLSSFGSDTIPAIEFLEEYYNADCTKELIAGSVPATEHSVMCMGLQDGEFETFERLLDIFPNGVLSVVSDTWSLPKVIAEYLPRLKDKIMKRNGTLVIRPDSFWTNPQDCVCGFDGYHQQMDKLNDAEKEVVKKGVVQSLWDIFGGAVNDKGYKVLDSHINNIYGDGCRKEVIEEICERLKNNSFASTNIVYGVGSSQFQWNTRDSLSWAVKATYGEVNHIGREIFKDPITDDGTKKSAKGLLQVKLDKNGEYVLRDQVSWEEEEDSELKTVFENGKIVRETSLAEIRTRLWGK